MENGCYQKMRETHHPENSRNTKSSYIEKREGNPKDRIFSIDVSRSTTEISDSNSNSDGATESQ